MEEEEDATLVYDPHAELFWYAVDPADTNVGEGHLYEVDTNIVEGTPYLNYDEPTWDTVMDEVTPVPQEAENNPASYLRNRLDSEILAEQGANAFSRSEYAGWLWARRVTEISEA